MVIAAHYMSKRSIPSKNLCKVICTDAEQCSLREYQEKIAGPIRKFITKRKLVVDFIVLTKGIPIRTKAGSNGGLSVDSRLACLDLPEDTAERSGNPYFGKAEPFRHAKFGIYLVSRLIGYTRDDCLRLIDRSILAKPIPGPFLLHTGPGHEGKGYKFVNEAMTRAHAAIERKSLQSRLSTGAQFAGGKELMGYYSWGSNDLKFSRKVYRSLTFLPGAIAETVVSTSGRTFDRPDAPGQSLIADLIRQGVTACKGYVSEPFADSIACADLLFDRYTSGLSAVESFWSASRHILWKDIVVGDPLCAPYAKSSRPSLH